MEEENFTYEHRNLNKLNEALEIILADVNHDLNFEKRLIRDTKQMKQEAKEIMKVIKKISKLAGYNMMPAQDRDIFLSLKHDVTKHQQRLLSIFQLLQADLSKLSSVVYESNIAIKEIIKQK
jgi:hypothetical protein